jgi:hypothetical protein
MKEYKFKYKHKPLAPYYVFLFFGIGTVIIAIAAWNEKRFSLFDIEIPLIVSTIFLWIFFAGFLFMSIVGILMIIDSRKPAANIIITDYDISSPKSGFNKKIVTIPFDNIVRLTIHNTPTILEIVHQNGVLKIPKAMLESNSKFEQMTDLIAKKIKN